MDFRPHHPVSDPDPVINARLALARLVRQRTVPVDRVDFEAACPACGELSQWREERIETRLKISITCQCAPEAAH